MPNTEFSNKILILLRQPKGKSAENTLDYQLLWTESHHKDCPSYKAQCQRHVTPTWERICRGDKSRDRSENQGKREDTN